MTKLRDSIPAIHKEGYIFIIIGVAFTFITATFLPILAFLAAFITAFIVCFFRDPNRVAPQGDDLIISPADGTVHKIEDAIAPEELNLGKQTFKRISIFLSVFNVHVNRVPVSGVIKDLHYRSGKFFNAALDKASTDNERQTCVVETKKGIKVVFVQIAGLIAKRIICDLEQNQEVKGGERFGIIRFGSRTDIYLPKDTEIKVVEGQTMVGGETILAVLNSAAVKKTPTIAAKKPAVKTAVKKTVAKKTAVKKKAPAKAAPVKKTK
jgi:phosphatidylserine decarboxylase